MQHAVLRALGEGASFASPLTPALIMPGWIAAGALVSFLLFILVGLAGVAQIRAEFVDESQEQQAQHDA